MGAFPMLVAHTTLQHDHNPWYTSYIVTIQVLRTQKKKVIVDSTYNGEKKLHEEILFQIGEDKIFSPMRFSRIALRVDKSNVLLDSSTPEIIYVYYVRSPLLLCVLLSNRSTKIPAEFYSSYFFLSVEYVILFCWQE